MIPHNEIKTTLLTELIHKDLICDKIVYENLEERAIRYGEKQYDLFVKNGFLSDWDSLLNLYPTKNKQKNIEYIIGTGASITAFLIAPFHLNEKKKEEAIYLGALVNLIVTSFDVFVDDKNSDLNWIGDYSEFLSSLLEGKTIGKPINEPHYKVMCALTTEYFSYAKKRVSNGWKMDCLTKYIGKMYRAQLKTIQPQDDNKTHYYINRKSALPFIIMGMSGWLMSNKEDIFYYKHLRWAHTFGSIIALTDDLADVEEDYYNANTNVLLLKWESVVPTEKEFFVFKQNFFRMMDELKNGWENFMQDKYDPSDGLSAVVSFSIHSWMKGSVYLPEKEPLVLEI